MRFNNTLWLCTAAILWLIAMTGCGPSGPRTGTPDWYWQAAHDTFTTGDYVKCDEHLEKLITGDNPYTSRAIAWRVILTAGMAGGYKDVADAFEAGARVNKTAPAQFRKLMNDYRALANRRAISFAETVLKFEQLKVDGDIQIPFGFPKGNPLPVPDLKRVGEGLLLAEAPLAAAERAAIERRILLTTCEVVGAGEDVARAQKLFTNEGARVSRQTFMLGVAKRMKDLAELYSPYKLDQPERHKLMVEKALAIVKGLPESDETKKMTKELEGTLKDIEKRLKGA